MSTGSKHVSILVVGAGTAGISVAARLRNLANAPEVALLDPSEHHYYQPLWTMVGIDAKTASRLHSRRRRMDSGFGGWL
jgi:NADH dehydrogenase FAD-containing subunit